MCGIAGIINLRGAPLDPRRLLPMCESLAHRGPDDAGYTFLRQGEGDRHEGGYWIEFTDRRFRHLNEHLPVIQGDFAHQEFDRSDFDLAIGHRRLSVLDLSHYGHQPMSSSDRRLWIAFNGEIYNFRELRQELEAKNHVFRTQTDTEVILHLWEELGEKSLELLDGMFAFTLFDRVRGRLFLVRDRFGVKPLYYAETGDHLLFASEPKAILASGLIEPRMNTDALAEYMTFQNLYRDETLFEGIKLLPAGQILEVNSDRMRREVSYQTYHPGLAPGGSSPTAFSDAADGVREKFIRAVERQLVSDVPVGAYLSGGMDSGSIVAVASRHLPRLATFTGGFDLTNVSGIEQGFDERPLAEELSNLLQTEHYAVVLHAGDMPAIMEQLTWHVDDPRLGMCHQNWYVSKLASRFVKVCLAGAGGDELFGGYPWRYRTAASCSSIDEFDELQFAAWHRLLPRSELPALLQGWLRPSLEGAQASFRSILGRCPDAHPSLSLQENLINRALDFEFRTFLQGFLLIEDRVSMAHGLESRVPFLDNELASFAWGMSPQHKVDLDLLGKDQSAHLETAEGKLVLRRAMEGLLPRQFTTQRKQGFSPPDANWYRGPSMNYVKEILLDRSSLDRPWFDPQFVSAKLEEHFTGRQNHRLLIWSLLSIEWLQRHFFDSRPTTE